MDYLCAICGDGMEIDWDNWIAGDWVFGTAAGGRARLEFRGESGKTGEVWPGGSIFWTRGNTPG